MIEFAATVLFSTQASKAAAFYRAIGVPLEDEEHDGGPFHHACDLGAVHFAVYPAEAPGTAPSRRAAGSTFAGFYVDSLDTVAAGLSELSAPLLGDHEQMPWGCRVVFEDPDGRAVEINQRGHCTDR